MHFSASSYLHANPSELVEMGKEEIFGADFPPMPACAYYDYCEAPKQPFSLPPPPRSRPAWEGMQEMSHGSYLFNVCHKFCH